MTGITWQQAALALTIILTSFGTVTYTDLFGVLFQLKGMDYNYTGNITCGAECNVSINHTTSYWRVCFANYSDTKYADKTLFKKVSRSRTLHVNTDNIDNIITTKKRLGDNLWLPYDIDVDWMVPTYGGKFRPIKDGDCWERKKINKIRLVFHKEPDETIKWSLNMGDYVDIDPILFGIKDSEIGYKFLNMSGDVVDEVDADVIYMWNTQDDYFINKSSGIQLTNHFQDYWTKNSFCIGYYNGGTWNLIKCSEDLSSFSRSIDTDNATYVNATLWNDFTYNDYDLRLGIRYHLGLDDTKMAITIYGKNCGADIPYDLGFAWKVSDWEIPDSRGDIGGDIIEINGTDYALDGTYDILFKNMTSVSVDYFFNETTGEFEENGTIYVPIPYFRGYDYDQFLRVDWDGGLDYAVKMVGTGNQSEFYVALLIDAGHFSPQQEKSTTFYWIDAVTLAPSATYHDNESDYSVESIRAMAVSSDGNYLFTSSDVDDYVSIMNITDKTTIVPLATYHDSTGDYSVDAIKTLAVSSDGNYLFTSSYTDDYVSIMNITDKTTIVPLATYRDSIGDYSVDYIKALAVSSDGNYLFTSSGVDDYVSIMNITDKTTIVPLATYYDSDGGYSVDGTWSLAVSSDGNYLFTSSYTDSYVSIMNITDKTSIVPLATYYDSTSSYSVEGIYALAVSSDGNYLFTSSYTDDDVSIMNITDKTSIVPLATYTDTVGDYSVDAIKTLAVSSDGNYLFISSNTDSYVSIMNITDKTSIVPLATYYDIEGDYSVHYIETLAVSSDGNYLFTSSITDDYVSIMDIIGLVDETSPTYSKDGHNTTVAGADVLFYIQYNDTTALHPAGQYIFSTNNTGTWTNESAVNFTITPNWANVSKTLNSTSGLTISYRWYADDNAGNINDTGIFTLTTTSADTCTCPDINNDWDMNMADWCNITEDCDLGTGKWNLTGVGEVRCNATITTTDMEEPPSGSILWIQNNCWIKVT